MRYELKGQEFNYLTVIGESGRGKNMAVLWECLCKCGATTYATTSALRNGHKKSCGCLRQQPKAEDLTGERFGRLTALRWIGTNKHRKAVWRCRCDCGKSTTVSSTDLKSGNTKSCGCLGKNFAKRNLYEWRL